MMKDFRKLFVERLQELMQDFCIKSKKELSRLCNCDYHAVNNWLEGKFLPRFSSLLSLTNYFHTTIDFLLGLSDDETFTRIGTEPCFWGRLETLMTKRHLTKYRLAKELHIGQPTISRWFEDKTIPETTTLIKLSLYFETTIEYMLGFTDRNVFRLPFTI